MCLSQGKKRKQNYKFHFGVKYYYTLYVLLFVYWKYAYWQNNKSISWWHWKSGEINHGNDSDRCFGSISDSVKTQCSRDKWSYEQSSTFCDKQPFLLFPLLFRLVIDSLLGINRQVNFNTLLNALSRSLCKIFHGRN